MLHLSFTHPIPIDSIEYNIEAAFNRLCDLSWFDDPLVQRAIAEVDGNTVYYGKGRWESPVLGVIGVEQLSGGVKTAIASYFMNDHYFPLMHMGENLSNTLQRFSEKKDIHFSTAGYIMPFNPGHMIYIDEWNEIIDGYYVVNEIVKRGDRSALATNIYI